MSVTTEQIEKAETEIKVFTEMLKDENLPDYRKIRLETKLHNHKVILKIAVEEERIRTFQSEITKVKGYIELLEKDQIRLKQNK